MYNRFGDALGALQDGDCTGGSVLGNTGLNSVENARKCYKENQGWWWHQIKPFDR